MEILKQNSKEKVEHLHDVDRQVDIIYIIISHSELPECQRREGDMITIITSLRLQSETTSYIWM